MWQSIQSFLASHRIDIIVGTATSLFATGIAAAIGVPARVMGLLRSRKSTSSMGSGTLAIVRDIYGTKSGWEPSTASSAKAMVSGSYLVTNRSSEPVMIAKVQAKVGKTMEGAAIVQWTQRLVPGATAPVVVTFFAAPNSLRKGNDLVVDLLFVDQLGNEHWLRREHFRSVPSLTD